MKLKLKKLEDQVIVITGASSGIGLATARLAAERKAKLVLAARNDEALEKVVQEIRSAGGEAIPVDADVSQKSEVRRIANDAIERFGRIDTWVNNAGVSVYGKLMEVSDEDHRRLFETNFWGVVFGSQIAIETMRNSGGGALINIGSVLSERAVPIQGMYSASKHAVKGFTDALRMELEEDAIPISVTLIKPASIDTPYVDHAKSYLGMRPSLTPPVYAPRIVAEAILHACEEPVRDLIVGGSGKMLTATERFPKIGDRLIRRTLFRTQRSGVPLEDPDRNSLKQPLADGEERGTYRGPVLTRSLYTQAALHPVATGFALSAVFGLAAAALFRR
jgi:short-subunit dehydrogenase